MIDLAINFLIELIGLIPYLVVVILTFNICASLLWGGRNE